jgi:hypothetical protein
VTRLVLAVLALLWPLMANAHETRPAYLELVEQRPSEWRVVWKQPVMGDRAVKLSPELSNGWLARKPVDEELTPSHYMRRWRIEAPAAGLAGARLTIGGLEHSITDVLVHVRTADGKGGDTILRPGRPSTTIAFGGWEGLAAKAYLGLGVEHILAGADHLAFVLGLVLLVGFNWRLVGVVSSFTVAHSLTLAASALGFVHAPTGTIEALVALSILFVARELLVGHDGSLTRRKPWLVAFLFGLLHGFAFAGALAETGLPEGDIPLALLLFNLGVEAGQLIFVAVLGAGWLALRRVNSLTAKDWQGRLAPYVMGCYAGFLFVERTMAAFA